MDDTPLRPLPQNKVLRGAYLMAQRFMMHNVGIQSAALSFYLLFMLFPMLIFFNALLGLLHMDVVAVLRGLHDILPEDVLSFANAYLEYVSEATNTKLLVFGLVFSIYFPMRTTNALMRAVRSAYHLGPPQGAIRHLIKTLIYTVYLIVTIVLTVVLMSVGERVLYFAITRFHLPTAAAVLWTQLRYPVAAALMFSSLYMLYAFSQDSHQPGRNIYPGVLGSLAAWFLVSLCYSFYVERIASYSVIYGPIGTMIVLLIWLYLTAMMLIMGAELNGMLISLRRERSSQPKA